MNMNTVPKQSQQNARSLMLTLIAAIPFLFVIAACTMPFTRFVTAEPTPHDQMASDAPGFTDRSELATDVKAATVAPPDPALEPPADLVEQPLNGGRQDAPEVWLVPSLQSKEELAIQIGADVTQLDWVNPGLPDLVQPGTLIVVPPNYLALVRVPMSTATLETKVAISPNSTISPAGSGK